MATGRIDAHPDGRRDMAILMLKGAVAGSVLAICIVGALSPIIAEALGIAADRIDEGWAGIGGAVLGIVAAMRA